MRLLETEADYKGWQKDTVEYVLCHKVELTRKAESILRMLKNTQSTADEVMSELYTTLYTKKDYQPEEGKESLGIESYISKFLLEVCQVLQKKGLEYANKCISTQKNEDGQVLDVLSTVPDTKSALILEQIGTEQLEQFKELEPYRYAYGLDIFDFLYVRVMGKLHKIDDKVQDAVLNVLGIDTEVVPKLRNKKQLKGVLKLLSTLGEKEFILCISPYVYSRDTILKGFVLKEREKLSDNKGR